MVNGQLTIPAEGTMTQTTQQKALYEQDLQLWFEEIIAKLRAQKLDELDIDHLIEEIEGLAGRDRREVRSRLKVLLTHLLKRIYIDSTYDNRGWENIIRQQRDELQVLLEQSPSLEQYFAEVFDDAWQYALRSTREEYRKVQFPDQWQFSRDVDTILSEKFWD